MFLFSVKTQVFCVFKIIRKQFFETQSTAFVLSNASNDHPQHLCVNTEHAEMSCQDKASSLYKQYDYMAEQTTGLWNNSLYRSKEEMFGHNVQNTSYQHKHFMTGC